MDFGILDACIVSLDSPISVNNVTNEGNFHIHEGQQKQKQQLNNTADKNDNFDNVDGDNKKPVVVGTLNNTKMPALPLPCSGESGFLETYRAKYMYENNENSTSTIKKELQYMFDNNMCLSLKQQSKFFTVKDKVIAWVNSQSVNADTDTDADEDLLYPSGRAKNFYAINVNGTNYAYRHIYKNGGTTVEKLTGNKHTSSEDLGNGTMVFATVRDPIDHFLSGWAECGIRAKIPYENPKLALNVDFDKRVQNWLKYIRGNKKGCVLHSHPQANYLLDVHNSRNSFDPRIKLLGDLKELNGLINAVGFTSNDTMHSRTYASNPLKIKRYPNDKTLLSDETLLLICNYVRLDYYLFDFTPPNVCRNQIESDMEMIEKMSL